MSPVLKAGKDATEPVSYRPISLLSNASKVVEKVVHSQLIRHCLDNRIIPDEQFGFLRGRSAELQLLSNRGFYNSSFRRCGLNFLVLQKDSKILVHNLSIHEKLEQSTHWNILKKRGKDFTFGSGCTVL